MDFKSLIDRINYLYHKSKEEGLTKEEKNEQDALRKQYIECMRNNVKAQLGTIKKEPNSSLKH